MIYSDEFHHVRDGEDIRIADTEQQLWCPNVGEWMTRSQHRERFAGAADHA